MASKKTSLLARNLIQGVLAILPLTITFLVLRFIFGFIEGFVDGAVIFLPEDLRQIKYLAILTELAATILLLGGLIFLGAIVKTVLGKFLLDVLDKTVAHIPVANAIYRSSRQLVELLSGEKQEHMMMNPVWVEYPREGFWAIGFDTGRIYNIAFLPKTEDYHSIFIPTTPNPTSGWLFIVPQSKIRPSAMTGEEAIKFILTGGVIKNATHMYPSYDAK